MCSFSQELIARYFPQYAMSLLIAGLFCCTVSNALAQEDFDDITITPGLQSSGTTFHGYAEYRIGISNRSPDKAHLVTLILPKASYGYSGEHIREMTRSVVVGPSATVLVSMLQPPVQLNGYRLGVLINGKMQEKDVSLPIHEHGRHVFIRHISVGGTTRIRVGNSDLSLRVLISRNVDATDLHTHADRLFTPLGSGSSSPSGGRFAPSSSGSAPYQTVDLGFPVSEWSTSWLGFSCYDGVVVTGDDIQRMPPDVQSALWRYVETGGALFVLEGRELPESWGLNGALKSELSNNAGRLIVCNVGFGECIVSPEMDTKSLDQDQWRRVVASWLKTAAPWQWESVVDGANTIFPVVNKLGIPVRGLFLLMLLFAVTIGPLNLILLSRRKRRIWMLWTTPVISLVACCAVFAYATFGEGWNRHARTEGLTILDERVRRAATIGWAGFYSALTPSEGLRFGYETEVTPLPQSLTTTTARTVDWTHDQHLANGWVTARIPAHFMVRKSELRRERITVRREADAGLRIVNGLGANISEFWLADKDGTIYSTTGIFAGAEAKLTALEEKCLDTSDEMFLFEMSDSSTNQALDKGNILDRLRYRMIHHGLLLSRDLEVSVEQLGHHWRITDLRWGRLYTIKADETDQSLRIYGEKMTNLRGIFASDDWIKNIEDLKTNPEKYLRPGCYIASLDATPFIEEGLQKVNDKRHSSVVYGILAEE